MRQAPELTTGSIASSLDRHHGIRVSSLTYLPIGYDLRAFVYKAVADDGSTWFVKVRKGEIRDVGLSLSRDFVDHGIQNVVAPILTGDGRLSCPLDGHPDYAIFVFPFIAGESAMHVGMTRDQWRTFGITLRTIHEREPGPSLLEQLPREEFRLPSAALVHEVSRLARQEPTTGAIASQFAAFWREHQSRIETMLTRAQSLGETLGQEHFDLVPCHTDIHAANILVGTDGEIWLVDWDDPLLAPRERDLLFVIGSRIARPVSPTEEAWFFERYGPANVNADALRYYRYERIIQDLGEFGQSIFTDEHISEDLRADEARLAMEFFAAGGDIERAESVSLT